MEALLEKFNQIVATADATARKATIVKLRQMADSLEDVDDTVNRLMHLPLELAVVRVGVDLKLYDLLAASEQPLSVAELSQTTGADPQLLARLLRFLSSHGTIKETGKDHFSCTNVTRNLVATGSQAGVCHNFGTVGPQYQELPAFLKKTNYKNITDPEHTVMQDTFGFEGGAFGWLGTQTEKLTFFNEYMAGRRHDEQLTWLSVYPIQTETQAWDPKAPVFVDMGGSIGHQCAALKAKHPDVPGRVILQDLAHSIAAALPTPGVENMTHDLFTPQPITGSKFYYMRAVLHDWPDVDVLRILKNTNDAMTDDSVLLIDEMVLPDTNVFAHVTSIDLSMMCALAAVERTETQWKELFAQAGFTLVQTRTYNPSSYESVMKFVKTGSV